MHEKAFFNSPWASFDPLDFEGSLKKKVLNPEQALMLAILRSVIEDFQEYVHVQRAIEKKLFHEAEEWILEEDTEWFFSFENICESLQLQPDYIRQGLLSWKEAKRRHTNRAAQSGRRRSEEEKNSLRFTASTAMEMTRTRLNGRRIQI